MSDAQELDALRRWLQVWRQATEDYLAHLRQENARMKRELAQKQEDIARGRG